MSVQRYLFIYLFLLYFYFSKRQIKSRFGVRGSMEDFGDMNLFNQVLS